MQMNRMIATALIYFHCCELRLRFIAVFGLRMLNQYSIFSCGSIFKKVILALSELQTVALFRPVVLNFFLAVANLFRVSWPTIITSLS